MWQLLTSRSKSNGAINQQQQVEAFERGAYSPCSCWCHQRGPGSRGTAPHAQPGGVRRRASGSRPAPKEARTRATFCTQCRLVEYDGGRGIPALRVPVTLAWGINPTPKACSVVAHPTYDVQPHAGGGGWRCAWLARLGLSVSARQGMGVARRWVRMPPWTATNQPQHASCVSLLRVAHNAACTMSCSKPLRYARFVSAATEKAAQTRGRQPALALHAVTHNGKGHLH